MLTPKPYKYLVYYSKVYFYLKTLNLVSVSLWIILIKHLPSLKLGIDTNLTQSEVLKLLNYIVIVIVKLLSILYTFLCI